MKMLVKIDPERRMYRWYAVGVQSTLIDGIAVIYGWGSLRSPFQQWRRISVDYLEEANIVFHQMIETRMKRGYILIGKEPEDFLAQ